MIPFQTTPTVADMARTAGEASRLMKPFFDRATHIRRDLEAQGWSPAVAEQIAGTWVIKCLTG